MTRAEIDRLASIEEAAALRTVTDCTAIFTGTPSEAFSICAHGIVRFDRGSPRPTQPSGCIQ